MEYLIKTYTNKGETVLDFCMGSGTTGVAALRLGREVVVPEAPQFTGALGAALTARKLASA